MAIRGPKTSIFGVFCPFMTQEANTQELVFLALFDLFAIIYMGFNVPKTRFTNRHSLGQTAYFCKTTNLGGQKSIKFGHFLEGQF